MAVAPWITLPPPPMTRATYLELTEGLNELDLAFRTTPASTEARRWVDAMWAWAQAQDVHEPTLEGVTK